jgi:uncharacterized protein (TIGR02266 family)
MEEQRRRENRVPLELAVRFRQGELEEILARESRDLSLGGMFIRCPRPASVGERIRFEIDLGSDGVVHGVGRVAWGRKPDPRKRQLSPGMGVQFVELADADRALLSSWLGARRAEPDLPPATPDARAPLDLAPRWSVQRTLLGMPSPAVAETPAPPPAMPATASLLGEERESEPPAPLPEPFLPLVTPPVHEPIAAPVEESTPIEVTLPADAAPLAPPLERRVASEEIAIPLSVVRASAPLVVRPRPRRTPILMALLLVIGLAVLVRFLRGESPTSVHRHEAVTQPRRTPVQPRRAAPHASRVEPAAPRPESPAPVAADAPPHDDADPLGPAREALDAGRAEEAVRLFQQAIDHRAPPMAYSGLGQAYEKLGDREAAIAAYRHFIELRPQLPEADRLQRRIQILLRTPPAPR